MNRLILLLEKGKQLLVSHVKGNPPILYLCLLSVDDFRIEPPTFEKKTGYVPICFAQIQGWDSTA